MQRMCTRTIWTLLLLSLLAAGCSSLPRDFERQASTAFDRPLETTIGRYFAAAIDEHPGQSGFRLVSHSREAFTMRVGLADVAERSLDLQYYIWEEDATGRILAMKLVDAADRGVRVRVLLDDNNFEGRDPLLAALDSHAAIEIRVFNPFANRGLHAMDFVTSFGRVNRRMHNKLMIADGAVAVIGGRNIGDHYFGVNTDANFRDLDLAMTGPVVQDASRSFDAYWNSQWAFPIGELHKETPTAEQGAQLAAETRRQLAERPYPYSIDRDVERLLAEVDKVRDRLIWASGRLVGDDPQRLESAGEGQVIGQLVNWLNGAGHELLIESAYFVPRDAGVRCLADSVRRGVKVRVMTNSLASNDVAAAHSGYEKYRKDLLRAGVQLFELRPDAGQVRQEWAIAGGRSIAALHTKALVVDRRSTFIGSFNLDPRSAYINTEIGLIVDSEELARQVAEFMDGGVVPGNAYHVTIDERGRVLWTTEVDGVTAQFEDEPNTTAWKRFTADFMRALPIDSQL
jgi:putative cardiolipin synthase